MYTIAKSLCVVQLKLILYQPYFDLKKGIWLRRNTFQFENLFLQLKMVWLSQISMNRIYSLKELLNVWLITYYKKIQRERYHTTTHEKVVQKNKVKSDHCHPTALSTMMEIFCISAVIIGTSQMCLLSAWNVVRTTKNWIFNFI